MAIRHAPTPTSSCKVPNQEILETEDDSIPPLQFLWLVQARKVAWDVNANTHILSIDYAAFKCPVELDENEVPTLEQYLDRSQENIRMPFDRAYPRALQPPNDTQPQPDPTQCGIETLLTIPTLIWPLLCLVHSAVVRPLSGQVRPSMFSHHPSFGPTSAVVQLSHGRCSATRRRHFSRYPATSWTLFGHHVSRYPATTWSLFGYHLAVVQPPCVKIRTLDMTML